MPITISSITHTIHRINQMMQFWTTQRNPSTSGSGPLNETKTPKGVSGPSLNEIQTVIRFRTITQRNRGVEGIPDHHSTESRSIRDSRPSLNGIHTRIRFRTITQWNRGVKCITPINETRHRPSYKGSTKREMK